MNCITCEIKRARMYTLAMCVLGKGLTYVAERLSANYGAQYYVQLFTEEKELVLFRVNTVTPSKPYRIHSQHVNVVKRA